MAGATAAMATRTRGETMKMTACSSRSARSECSVHERQRDTQRQRQTSRHYGGKWPVVERSITIGSFTASAAIACSVALGSSLHFDTAYAASGGKGYSGNLCDPRQATEFTELIVLI